MMISKEELISRARVLGVDDVRFAPAQGSLAFSKTEHYELGALIKGASCIILLFTGYLPAGPAPEGFMPLSSYYVASHTGYRAAKAVAAQIRESGFSALHDTHLPARAAALRTGGFIGANGFYYHDRLGSCVSIHTILTDAFLPDNYAPAANLCSRCGACKAACPSGATADLSRCLRKHINQEIPEALRGDIYQILGCEKCQQACPLNPAGTSEPHLFSIADLLSGAATDAVRELAGSNFVRPGRLASQAALYAAATGQKQVLPLLWELAQTAEEPVRTHARWAAQKLEGGPV